MALRCHTFTNLNLNNFHHPRVILYEDVYAIFGLAFLTDSKYFPSISLTFWNLLLLMTLDDWSSAYRKGPGEPEANPYHFLFAFTYILILTFLLLRYDTGTIFQNLGNITTVCLMKSIFFLFLWNEMGINIYMIIIDRYLFLLFIATW